MPLTRQFFARPKLFVRSMAEGRAVRAGSALGLVLTLGGCDAWKAYSPKVFESTGVQEPYDPTNTPVVGEGGEGGDGGGGAEPAIVRPADIDCADVYLGPVIGLEVAGGEISGSGDDHGFCADSMDADSGWGYYRGPGDDLLFYWQAPADGQYTIDTVGSTFDTMLTAYRDSCDERPLGCDDDGAGVGLTSILFVRMERGEPLIIAVDAYSAGESGTFVLNIAEGWAWDSGGRWETGGGWETGGWVDEPVPALHLRPLAGGVEVLVEGGEAWNLGMVHPDGRVGESCGLLAGDGEQRCHSLERRGPGLSGLVLNAGEGGGGLGYTHFEPEEFGALGFVLYSDRARGGDGRCFVAGAGAHLIEQQLPAHTCDVLAIQLQD